MLRFLDRHVGPQSQTLETGAGLSTVVFAGSGTSHTCVTPGDHEVERIRSYCAERGISTDSVTFCVGSSESLLPSLEPSPLDLVLIDGSHSFPSPFIDWFYTASRLRVGGHVIIDDTQLWTGWILARFLREEPEWELVKTQRLRTAVFVKRSPLEGVKDWMDQPFVVRRSRVLRASYTAGMAVELLRRGEVSAIVDKARRRMHRRVA